MINTTDYRQAIDEMLLPIIPTGSSVAIFDYPNYGNVGDSAIWLGQKAFLDKNKIVTVHVDDASVGSNGLPKLSRETIILITGGGNFGDIYLNHQTLREHLICNYKNNRIVQLPQSIHYDDPKNAQLFSQKLKEHPDFHLVVRDESSLELAEKMNPGRAYICPDMALYLEALPLDKKPTRRVVALLRRDREKHFETGTSKTDIFEVDWTKENKLIKRMVKLLNRVYRNFFAGKPSSGIKMKAYDTAASWRLKRGCRLLGSGKLVITDRLHGHILSTMMDIPNIVLDNRYGKIANFRERWKTGEKEELCIQASSYDQALSIANDKLKSLSKRP